MCDELFYVDRYYSDHLKNIHNINKNDYKGCFGLGVTRKVTQNCQLCKGNTKEFLMDQVFVFVFVLFISTAKTHIDNNYNHSINWHKHKL